MIIQATIECLDAFLFTGKLLDCPEWLQDLSLDGEARVKNDHLSIHAQNGYHIVDKGNLVVRTTGAVAGGFNIQIIRDVTEWKTIT